MYAKPPKAILFDLGRVLIPFEFMRAYRRWEALTGIPAEEVRSRLAATTLFRQFETGCLDAKAFSAEVMEILEFRCSDDEFSQAWNSIFVPETLIPENTIEYLGQRYILIVVSNTNSLHFEMLKNEYPILRHFQGYTLSFEVKAMKPDPAFYAAALKMAGCVAAECIFIDDLPENVEGAALAGFDSILFQTYSKLKEDLAVRGVTVPD